jgi:hypothetical protein
MKKKIIGGVVILFAIIALGTVFAESVCNFYESGTDQIAARISISSDYKTATIEVNSYVSRERIEIYQVIVDGTTFTTWNISGNKVISPHGSTTITVTRSINFNPRPSFKVFLKTCD